MEKRIRLIWILSLFSALLLIGVQGYWLYNQYRHVVDAHAQELAGAILEAGEKEFNLRKQEVKPSYAYMINKNIRYTTDSLDGAASNNQRVFLTLSGAGSDEPVTDSSLARIRHLTDLATDSIASEMIKYVKTPKPGKQTLHVDDSPGGADEKTSAPEELKKIVEDALIPDDGRQAAKEMAVLSLSMSADLPEDQSHNGIDRAITNFRNPYREEILDSILTADLPGINYTVTPMTDVSDATSFSSSWQYSGNLFSPCIEVRYLYSPFERKGVNIKAFVPSQPLFSRMAIQLFLSLGLILLLIGCLILQVKTILKQKKINEMREEFVNTMIHELKRPVQTLKTFISFLGNKEMRSDEPATEQVVQDSMFELDNLSAYLRKLKDMIRAHNGDTTLQISRFNLQELIGKIIRLINNSVVKDVKISVHYEMESVWIEADPVHIANVVNNLVENAIKYSGEHVEIKVEARLKGKELGLTVSDDGIGIPYSEQEKVFAKFYRGSNLPDKNIPGIGLGLSYVKLIAEAHKGYVSLLSETGRGTSITLCIPQ